MNSWVTHYKSPGWLRMMTVWSLHWTANFPPCNGVVSLWQFVNGQFPINKIQNIWEFLCGSTILLRVTEWFYNSFIPSALLTDFLLYSKETVKSSICWLDWLDFILDSQDWRLVFPLYLPIFIFKEWFNRYLKWQREILGLSLC